VELAEALEGGFPWDFSYRRVNRQITEGPGNRRDVRKTTSVMWPSKSILSTPMRVPLETGEGKAPRRTWMGTASPGQPMMLSDVDVTTGTDVPQGATILPTRRPVGTRGSRLTEAKAAFTSRSASLRVVVTRLVPC
jgi:hypothetical protein